MSYQVLARKWRPRTFEQMAGQEHVLRALTNGLANGRLHHAFLFTGTRGVGKTTVARILAKCLNCETNGVSPQPCGECDACREIDEGRFVDLIEVDAASRTKVEDTRELLDNVQYAPTRGRFKIYLVDEVHMLSAHSFNALLKTLEEPPPHVKFLLATTDPQKLPVTILSRCLQFNLKHLPASLIAEHLSGILGAESIDAEPEALQRLARAADGSMRDALSLLDQAIAFGGGAVTDEDVRGMLGSIESDFVLELLEALAAEDGAGLLEVVGRMAERAPDFGDALAELLATLHQLTLAQVVPAALEDSVPERERLTALAERFSPEDVQLFYQIALTGRRDLPLAPEPRTGFEMVMLRMLAFRPVDTPAAEAPPPAPTERAPTGAGGSTNSPAKTQAAPASAAPAPAPAKPEAAAAPRPAPAAEPARSEEPAIEKPVGQASQVREPAGSWEDMVAALSLGGMAKALASHCVWVGREGDMVRLSIDKGHGHLVNPSMKERLGKALGDYLGEAVRLQIDVGEAAGETPADLRAKAAEERQRAAEAAIESDPNISAMQEAFGARVIPDSVRPVDD